MGEGQGHILEEHVGEQIFLELSLENAINRDASDIISLFFFK